MTDPWLHRVPDGTAPNQPPLAEWWERLLARLLDSVAFGVANAVISAVVFAVFGASLLLGYHAGMFFVATLLAWVLSGLAYAAYDYLMHARDGQTLGKLALGIRLVSVDGRPLQPATLLRRSLAYPGIFALAGLLAGLGFSAGALGSLAVIAWSVADGIPVFTDEARRQALHDRFAGTVVVRAARPA